MRADVVVLDLNMPGLDGVETLSRLRILRPELRVLLATGFADERIPAALARFPDVKTLMKPFSRDELAQSLAGFV